MKNFYSHSISKNLLICLLSFICVGKLWAQTNVSGNQSGTWTKANSPYVITGNITISVGQTLTIDAGVTVNFTNGSSNTSQFIVQGTLKAQGTITDSIYFTGLGLGQYQQAGPINIQASSIKSILQYVKINGIGYYYNSDYTPAVIVSSSFCSIENCTFQNMNGSALQIDQSTPTINANTFSNTGLDIIADLDKLQYLTNNNPLKIGLTHQLDMSNTRDTLKPSNTYYKLLANQTIPLSKILIIQPGTVLQFTNGNNTISQLDVQGTLLAQGTRLC